jgi:hypothetical protein
MFITFYTYFSTVSRYLIPQAEIFIASRQHGGEVTSILLKGQRRAIGFLHMVPELGRWPQTSNPENDDRYWTRVRRDRLDLGYFLCGFLPDTFSAKSRRIP